MIEIRKAISTLVLSAGFAVGALTALQATPMSGYQAYPQGYPQTYPQQRYPQGYPQAYPPRYNGVRGVVDRTQQDLSSALAMERRGGNQRQRYNDAQGHLSSFDRHLVKGRFDRGELGKAMGSIRAILDKNVLQASSRDALMRDLDDLRRIRSGY